MADRQPRRGRRRGAALLVALAMAVVAAPPAAAQPPTPAPPTATPAPDADGPRPDDLPPRFDDPLFGPVELERYDLGTSTSFLDPTKSVMIFLADTFFTIGRWIVGVVVWAVEWVYGFEIGHRLAGVVGTLSDLVGTDLVARLNLGQLALLASVTAAAVHVFRHRGARAVSEVLTAALVLAVGTVATADGGHRVACGGLNVLATVAGDVLALAGDLSAPAPSDVCADGPVAAGVVEPFVTDLVEGYVVEPHLLLNWGQIPEPGSPCRTLAAEVVAWGPWGNHDGPRDAMTGGGCVDMVAFNERVGTDRTVGALAYAAAAGVLGLAVIGVAFTVAVAQVVGAVLVVLMPLALAVGIAPGLGRHLLRTWVAWCLRTALMVLATSFLLAFMVQAVGVLLAATRGEGLVERLALVTAVTVVLLQARKRVTAAAGGLAVTGARGVAAAGTGATPGVPDPGSERSLRRTAGLPVAAATRAAARVTVAAAGASATALGTVATVTSLSGRGPRSPAVPPAPTSPSPQPPPPVRPARHRRVGSRLLGPPDRRGEGT